MKYIKLLAMMLLPLTFAACSDDDENMNSGNATVGFSQSEIDVKENVSSIQVPITVTGEHSGLIEVTVTVKNASGISVENDKTVLLTSEKIRVPADVETVNAEIYLNVSTKEDNFDRSFTLEIANAQGATIGTGACKVNIQELVDPYDKLIGDWTFQAVDSKGVAASFPVVVEMNEKGDGYNCTKFNGKDYVTWRMSYSSNGLQIICNETIADNMDFGLGFTASVRFASLSSAGLSWANVSGMWSDDFETITFDSGVAGAIMDDAGNYSKYVWFQYYDCKMVR